MNQRPNRIINTKTKEINIPMEPIDQLRKIIVRDITVIPYFINTKKLIHKEIWSQLQLLLRLLSKLTNKKVLNDKQIKEIYDNSMAVMDEITPTMEEENLKMEIEVFIMMCVNTYCKFSMDNELFEIRRNFEKFENMERE